MMGASTGTTPKEVLRRVEMPERKLDIVIRKMEALEEGPLTEEDLKELQEIRGKISRGDYSGFVPTSDVSLDYPAPEETGPQAVFVPPAGRCGF